MLNRPRFALLLALTLLLSSSCVNLTKTTQSNQSAPSRNAPSPPVQTKLDASSSAAASVPTNPSRIFKGTIGDKYQIQMTLVRDGEALNGSYFYERKGGDITLKGTIDRKGIFELREVDAAGRQTGVFKGQWHEHDYDPEATLDGNWSKPDGSDEQSFYLDEQAYSPVKITTQHLNEQNKQRRYTIEVEYPQLMDASYDACNAYVRDLTMKLVNGYKHDEGPATDGPDAPPEAAEDSFNVSYTMRLVTPELVSVEFEIEQYQHGAAHPNHGFEVVNYDVRAGRALKLADLFKPDANYLKLVAERATEKLRLMNKDAAKESGGEEPFLTDSEFASGVAPKAENYRSWTLTGKGLVIRYAEYQIAPYAAGAPVVQVPYAELKDALRPGGPVAALTH